MCRTVYDLRIFISILLCFATPYSMAAIGEGREIAGVKVSPHITQNGIESRLVLNGLGIRYKFFFKVYVAALYLPEADSNSLNILQKLPANRMMMHITYSEVPYEKLVSGWVDGFKSNTSSGDYSILESRLKQFNEMFSSLYEGDVVLLDYLPGEGTRVTIKGVEKGMIKGADFNRALLSVWLGENPITEELKSKLLGLPDD